MRALVQRVSQASVSVQGEVIASIGQGLTVLLGVGRGDTEEDAFYLAEKVANLRIFSDEADKFNLSALDVNGEALVISQFTLYARTRKGRRPSFTEAALPQDAEPMVGKFVHFLHDAGLKAGTGRFQQHMQVEIYNDGPVTLLIDSVERLTPRN
ncbi:D-aminoacyl-tRNA deacylase [Chloroflexota bacterium]